MRFFRHTEVIEAGTAPLTVPVPSDIAEWQHPWWTLWIGASKVYDEPWMPCVTAWYVWEQIDSRTQFRVEFTEREPYTHGD